MRPLQPQLLDRPSPPRRRAQPPYDAMLTAEGRQLLEEKADELRAVTLPALLEAVADDPYDAATRAAYDDVAAELRRVEAVLSQAQPIPTQPDGSDLVSLGDAISVAFLASTSADVISTELRLLLVHPFEAPLDSYRISVNSPLGRAVLGRRVDDTVTFDTPTGTRRVRILDRQPAT